MEDNNALVFVFYNTAEKRFLIEKRVKGQFLAGTEIFPGGKVENAELDDYFKTLKRECFEEFGIVPLEYYKLEEPVIGESGYKLWPCLITRWQGIIPKEVKDKGSLLNWVTIKKYKSNVKSQMEIYKRIKDYISKHNL